MVTTRAVGATGIIQGAEFQFQCVPGKVYGRMGAWFPTRYMSEIISCDDKLVNWISWSPRGITFLGKTQSFDFMLSMVPPTRMHPDVGGGLQFPLLHCPITCSTKHQEVHATRGTSWSSLPTAGRNGELTWKDGRRKSIDVWAVSCSGTLGPLHAQRPKLQTWFPFNLGFHPRCWSNQNLPDFRDRFHHFTNTSHCSLHRVTYSGRSCTSTLLRCTMGRTGWQWAVLTNQVFFTIIGSYIPMNWPSRGISICDSAISTTPPFINGAIGLPTMQKIAQIGLTGVSPPMDGNDGNELIIASSNNDNALGKVKVLLEKRAGWSLQQFFFRIQNRSGMIPYKGAVGSRFFRPGHSVRYPTRKNISPGSISNSKGGRKAWHQPMDAYGTEAVSCTMETRTEPPEWHLEPP